MFIKLLVMCASIICVVVLVSCESPVTENYSTPVRPQLDQFVLGGELAFDASFNNIIRKDRIPAREVRKPLRKLHEILKGSDFHRNRTATFLPLGAGLSDRPCGSDLETCPGAVVFAEALYSAGVDVVSLAAPAVSGPEYKAILADTRSSLAKNSALCLVGGDSTGRPCAIELGDTKVAVYALSASSSEEKSESLAVSKKMLSGGADGDVVVVMVALSPGDELESRRELLRKISDHTNADVVMGHYDGPFDAIERRDDRLILHNAGSMLSRKSPWSSLEYAMLFRFHCTPSGIAWMEGLPIKLKKGRSRQAYLDEANEAIGRLVGLSQSTSSGLKVEFGRLILELKK